MMLASRDENLEDKIVKELLETPSSIKNLHEKLGGVTLRAIYKATHNLLKADVIVKAGTDVHINEEWREKLGSIVQNRNILSLNSGEKVSYNFTSVERLDSFWTTTVLPIERGNSPAESFFYNPHNFWAYVPSRKEGEDAYYRSFAGSKYGFFTLGGKSEADKEFKRAYQSENLQIDTRPVEGIRRTDHITVLGTYVLTVRLGKGVADRIDAIYASDKGIKDIMPSILKIIEKPGRMRFTIERNKTKAAVLRKTLAKNFYFKRPE